MALSRVLAVAQDKGKKKRRPIKEKHAEMIRKLGTPTATTRQSGDGGSSSGSRGSGSDPGRTDSGVFRNETGRLSGVELPSADPNNNFTIDGRRVSREEYLAAGGSDKRAFVGMSPTDARELIEQQRVQAETPLGSKEVGDIRETERATQIEADLRERGAELSTQIGAPHLNPEDIEQFEIDREQAAKAGVTAVIPGAITSTGAAATGGFVFSGGNPMVALGAAGIGLVFGAIRSYYGGVQSDINSQLGGEIGGHSLIIEKVQTNCATAVNMVHIDPARQEEWLGDFNNQLALADNKYGRLHLLTQKEVAEYLGKDGTQQMIKYETFNAPGGVREQLVRKMESALLNPDPTKVQIVPEVREAATPEQRSILEQIFG